MIDMGPILRKDNQFCVGGIIFNLVKKNPDTGGVTRPPKPQPMKKIEESLPVMFLFLATQEKAEPNCHEMKKPRVAVPRYRAITLEPAITQRNTAVIRHSASDTRIMFLEVRNVKRSCHDVMMHAKVTLV